jgi:rhodanese-related sulfurtransferase
MHKTITANEASSLLKQDSSLKLIDVRSPAEYRSIHAEGAINIPLDIINEEKIREVIGKSDEVVIICQSGKRGEAACKKLESSSISKINNIEGGTGAWAENNLPVVKGQGMISIERQVRIAAGMMVFTGVLLGVFVHSYWLILPGFVGAGLTFAGITDFCGMGLILAKMPWNR